MVGGYFAELAHLLEDIYRSLKSRGSVWIIVGDSRYGGIRIETAAILSGLAPSVGYRVINQEPFRSMRCSPQQGGNRELAESLIVLQRD